MSDLFHPKAGDVYRDGHNPGCSWRVEAIGERSKTVYVRMLRDGKPTKSEIEWPLNRWPHFVDTQRLT